MAIGAELVLMVMGHTVLDPFSAQGQPLLAPLEVRSCEKDQWWMKRWTICKFCILFPGEGVITSYLALFL